MFVYVEQVAPGDGSAPRSSFLVQYSLTAVHLIVKLGCMYHVQSAGQIRLESPALYAPASRGYTRAALVGKPQGAVHTGFHLSALEPAGSVGTHLHSIEESFYVLSGNPQLSIDARTYRLGPGECGLLPVGVPHAWSNPEDGEARWLEMQSPAPRVSGPADTFFTGDPVPQETGRPLDVRDPRSRLFFHLGDGQMDVDNLKIGAGVNAPTVSSSMATALLAYSGIAVKMLVDSRLGAVLHSMFMVEYQPGGVAQPHDHPLEEAYYVLEGEVEATAGDNRFTLRAGDVFWTGVGCIHAFHNTSDAKVRWLETQAPQLPANYSYRFNRDWDYLQERLSGNDD
jgi:quercetin dioxygenase-like cupin family protein